MKQELDEITEHLNVAPEDIPLEHVLDPSDSPLNEPVAEDQIGLASGNTSAPPPHESMQGSEAPDLSAYDAPEPSFEPAPEDEPEEDAASEGFDMPDELVSMTADSYLGMVDYVLELSANFFIKIHKNSDFYEYDELVQMIDEQNAKNVARFKLDEDDKAMVKPVLELVIKRSGKSISPESQLVAVGGVIIIKKVQLAAQMRQENKSLTAKFQEIIEDDRKKKQEEAKQQQELDELRSKVDHLEELLEKAAALAADHASVDRTTTTSTTAAPQAEANAPFAMRAEPELETASSMYEDAVVESEQVATT